MPLLAAVALLALILVAESLDAQTTAKPPPAQSLRGSGAPAPEVPVSDEPASQWPYLIPLLRESVPVRRKNQTISYKTSYSGLISIGRPAQEFRVVFDTGSAHIVVPSSECRNATCLMHRRYNISESSTAVAINLDGEPVDPEELCDQVTIGYGTGKVTGEFVRDQVCLGGSSDSQDPCIEVNVVMAVEMTHQPFSTFSFDGIFGLALDSLAVAPEFSFFNRLAGGAAAPALRFGVFLSDVEEDAMSSEIALGGHNPKKMLGPLRWTPVASRKMGYWQVEIKAIRIGNRTLDICGDGTCRGVVDTGTSHLGIPGTYFGEFAKSLSAQSAEDADCREVEAPTLELELNGLTLKLNPEHYMRRLSLPPGVDMGSSKGVSMEGAPGHEGAAAKAAAVVAGSMPAAGSLVTAASASGSHTCTPRLMPVNLPAPLGPNLFILGEPVLHRYYTVYDWQASQIGFALAATAQNAKAITAADQQVDDEDIYSLMQVTITLTVTIS